MKTAERDQTIGWREHPTSGMWHAFRSGEEWSVCGYTNRSLSEVRMEAPVEGSCLGCRSVLRGDFDLLDGPGTVGGYGARNGG